MKGYCGTYTTGRSDGIYSFEFDVATGELSNTELFTKVKSPKFIAVNEKYVFSIFESEEGAGVCIIDKDGVIIDSIIIEQTASCFLIVKENYIYTANYHEGLFSVLSWENDQLTLIFQDKVQDKAGCHHVFFVDNLILVPCLFLDKVLVYNEKFERVDEILLPKGSGPRNGVYAAQRNQMFLLCELSNELVIFGIKDKKFILNGQFSVLENGETHYQQSSALRMTQDEKYLVAGTRGKDIVSILDIQGNLLETTSTQGRHPRDLVLSKDDRFIVVANRDTDSIITFDFVNGEIKNKVSELWLPEGIAIAWEEA